VSLNDQEWSEYQDILSDVINSHDELYASYDAEGNLIAKNKDGMVDLNDAMEKSIELQK
jgi:hypothetical protein